MADRHVLLSSAVRYPARQIESIEPQDAEYANRLGAWTRCGKLLIQCEDRKQETKKYDIETGEDQKGE